MFLRTINKYIIESWSRGFDYENYCGLLSWLDISYEEKKPVSKEDYEFAYNVLTKEMENSFNV